MINLTKMFKTEDIAIKQVAFFELDFSTDAAFKLCLYIEWTNKTQEKQSAIINDQLQNINNGPNIPIRHWNIKYCCCSALHITQQSLSASILQLTSCEVLTYIRDII